MKRNICIWKKIIATLLLSILIVSPSVEAATSSTMPTLWLNMKGFYLLVGDYHTLIVHGAAASQVKWISTRPGVASVDKTGRVTAKKPGKTVIKVKYKKKVAKCNIVVRKDRVKKETYSAADRLLLMNKKNVKPYNSQQALCTDDKGNVYIFRTKSNSSVRVYKIRNTDNTVKGLITSFKQEMVETTLAPTAEPITEPAISQKPTQSMPTEMITVTGEAVVSKPAVKEEKGPTMISDVSMVVSEPAVSVSEPAVSASEGGVSVSEQVTTTAAVTTTPAVAQTATPEAIATDDPKTAFCKQAIIGTFDCLGHANDATYKSDGVRTSKGIYVATDMAGKPGVVQISEKETYDEATGTYQYEYQKVASYDVYIPYLSTYGGKKTKKKKKISVSGISYDKKSHLFVIKESGVDQYYVGYFKKSSSGRGSFVPTGSFRLQNTLDLGNLDFYSRQGITYKDGILYVSKSGQNNDCRNNSLVLQYKLGGLKSYKNKKQGRILISKQKIWGSNFEKSNRHYFNYKKGNAKKYKFEIEGLDFIGNKLVFITNEKASEAGTKVCAGLYVLK